MRKLLLVFAMSLGAVVTVNAQENNFAVKGGVNIATLIGDDVSDVNGTIGFHVGALYQLGITDNFSFQPELLLSAKGAEGRRIS